MDEKKLKELRKLFHELWGKAVETKSYDKEEWNELQRRLTDLGLPV